ncbi:MAG: hypothetical protein RMJ15_01150 [Nitrososphaerota archaeon]|nr:hypothetical protein [Nitrososphaerota archaeon]
MPTTSLVLPFAVQKDTNEVFTLNMEAAAVLLLAEMKRRKLGFLRSSEKITLVSKMYYPLWLVPWGEKSLVLDGLETLSSTITYQELPSLEMFLEDVEQGFHVRERFRLSLEKHKKTFENFVGSVEVKFDALISEKELLSAIFEYVRESASFQPRENVTLVLAPPKLDAQKAMQRARQLLDVYGKVCSDIMGMDYAKKVLVETVDFHEQMILKEIRFVQESYGKEIAELAPVVEDRVNSLEKERDAEIAKITKGFEKILKAKEKEKKRRELELQKLELQKAELKKRWEARKRKDDKVGLARLEHRINLCESKIREVEKKLHALNKFLEETRRQNENDVEKLSRSYKELIEKEKGKIASLEAQRDEKVMSKRREIDALRLASSQIAKQIEELMEKKRRAEKELEGMALPWQVEDISLACLPFYLAGYRAGNKTKLQIFPPVTLSWSGGALKTFRRTLLGFAAASKIKLLLQPRSQVIGRMLDSALKKRVKSDKAFSEAFHSAAASANILASQRFKETLSKGLEELKVKGLVGQKEADLLAGVYL